MRSLLALLALVLLSLCVSACGGASKDGSTSQSSSVATSSTSTAARSASSTAPAPVVTKADGDRDNDIGAFHDNADNGETLDFGHAASAADQQAVTALVKRYYEVALAEDGAKACSMIYTTYAEAIAEDYGQASAGPAYLQPGKTCPEVMVLLFKHFHNQLVAEIPKLKVSRVRLHGRNGWAVLSFGSMPERELSVAREGRTWKVNTLLDIELP